MRTNLQIDRDKLSADLDTLGGISSEPLPVVTRVVFTEADLRARRFIQERCEQAGLRVHADAVGNTFARWVGTEPELPAVGTGSHIDAIPNAGRFDGTVGVLGGLEAICALKRTGFQPRRSVELVLFTSEEPTRFGIGCLGSRMLSGALPEAGWHKLVDSDSRSLDEVRRAAGFAGDLSEVVLPRDSFHAFLEMHIEQGPTLEQQGLDVGIVTAIAAPATLRIEVEGEGGHAGAVLMPQRRDALLAAAEIALAVEAAAKSTGSVDTVATTGVCDIFPRAVNSIPSKARMEVDVRDIDGARRDRVLAQIVSAGQEVGARRKVAVRHEVLNADPPAQCDSLCVQALREACAARRATYVEMISRAYHDSLFMSLIAPVAMLFIPCRGGVSHRPDEYASPEAIACGVLVLAEAIGRLAG